jgi:hypothetical protein
MNRRDLGLLLGLSTLAETVTGRKALAQASQWSLAANVAECCSCAIPCPCNFGRPTRLRCDGNRLIEIYDGQVEGKSLAGIRFVVAFEMGKSTRVYVDESLSDAQFEGYDAIMPLAFAGFRRLALSEERVPISVDRGKDSLSFSTPASEVEMRPLAGLDGGLIRIDGLPSNSFLDYVQYESVRHRHRNEEREWSYSGTNGFVSRMIASG